MLEVGGAFHLRSATLEAIIIKAQGAESQEVLMFVFNKSLIDEKRKSNKNFLNRDSVLSRFM